MMIFDKDFQVEITRFTKLCKEKQEHLLTSCAREEKRLHAEYETNSADLQRRHQKQAEKFKRIQQGRMKSLHKTLEIEMDDELKLYRRYAGLRSRSTGRIDTSRISDLDSNCSLPIDQMANGADTNRNEVIRQPTSDGQNDHPNMRRGLKWKKRKPQKNTNEEDLSVLRHGGHLEANIDRLKKEMDERIQYAKNEGRRNMGELEWKFLLERHDLKRDFLHTLAEFKQRRLTSLGQLKKAQIKGYYDVHRKWLMEQHTRELNARHRATQECIKRLAATQGIERQTAWKLARTTAKGQTKVTRILNSGTTGECASGRIEQNSMSHSASRAPSTDAALIDMLFPRHETNNATDELQGGSHGHRSASRLPVASFPTVSRRPNEMEPRAQSAMHIPLHVENETAQNGGSLSNASSHHMRHPKTVHGKLQLRRELHHAKSLQSLQSTLTVCDQMQRAVVTTLSKQQVDQWTVTLDQERVLTDALMRSHIEQKEALIQEETAALKRAQEEQENRAAHLAVVLEATERFTEKEFADERQDLTEFYYGGVNPPAALTEYRPLSVGQDYPHSHTANMLPHDSATLRSSTNSYTEAASRVERCITVNESSSAEILSNMPPSGDIVLDRAPTEPIAAN
ncbi:unnamed protein product [Calicophoron daubneyi]|uniref:Uncharacterized protein n=1 Tax=Calicophoron daubneyi TaxID=300641 RepID=A0AAV2T8Q3_CALDB